MRVPGRVWIPLALLASLIAGTIADRPEPSPAIQIGGYRVLSADFHLHSGLWSGGTLTPWGLVLEAERQGLDVIALTAHNETADARVARAFSRIAGGPVVLIGEEVTSATQDLIAIHIDSTISPKLSLPDQIEEVHRQGGLAIAAHPVGRDRTQYADVLQAIDGAEVCHPAQWERDDWAADLEQFKASTPAMPIGSSDFHFMGHPGSCRTFVFARDATEPAVMVALREHHTVVYLPNGHVYGDPELVKLADAAGLQQRAQAYTRARGSLLDWVSRVLALLALFGIAASLRSPASRRVPAGLEFPLP
ncbi:MAG TPA: hypothetical protein VL173_11795 [Vicinamibacterales bacterium]|jgi:predicted metal-dependent phosphoesterase TrpH|nr:hypothetical protein [Vicinamibacterales bacterium]